MIRARQAEDQGMSGMANAKVLSRRILLKAPKRFVHERLEMPDKNEIDWYYLDTPASVMIVPLTESGNLILVEQFRYNLGLYTLELPAGALCGDEEPVEAAKRELFEETGFGLQEGGELISLGQFYSLPSETNKQTHLFLATPVHSLGEPTGDTEIEEYFGMAVNEVPLDEALASVGSRIHGMETLGALLLARDHLAAVHKQ